MTLSARFSKYPLWRTAVGLIWAGWLAACPALTMTAEERPSAPGFSVDERLKAVRVLAAPPSVEFACCVNDEQKAGVVERIRKAFKDELARSGLLLVTDSARESDLVVQLSLRVADLHVRGCLTGFGSVCSSLGTGQLRLEVEGHDVVLGSDETTVDISCPDCSTWKRFPVPAAPDYYRALIRNVFSQAPVLQYAEAHRPSAKPAPPPASGLVAVLPLRVMNGAIDDTERQLLEETIRTTAGDQLSSRGFTVLTSENTLKILTDNGVDPSKACEASCALEAAREIKASLFISGSIAREGQHIVLFARLFDQSSGRQISSLELDGATPREVRLSLERQAAELFRPLAGPAAQH